MGTNEEKLALFTTWFEGEHVLVHLDSRREAVLVPDQLAKNHSLTLKLSRRFQGQTDFNDDEIRAHLKFDGVYRECVLPWDAIWGMTSAESEQRIWTDDLPTEVISTLAMTKLREIGARILGRTKDATEKEEKAKEKKTEEEKVEEGKTAPPGGKRKPPKLRRVK